MREMLLKDADHCVAVWKNVLVWVSVGPVHVSHARLIDDTLGRIDAQHPGTAVFLLIGPRGGKLPGTEARRAVSDVLKKRGSTLQGVAAAFEGSGFWTSTGRAVISGIVAMARQPFSFKVFSTRDEAIDWLATDLKDERGEPFRRQELAAVAAELLETNRLLKKEAAGESTSGLEIQP